MYWHRKCLLQLSFTIGSKYCKVLSLHEMKRRQFISGATLMGAGIFVNPLTHFAGLLPKEKFQHNPVEDLINVACVISARTTNIDWVGPEAVFQTWHFNRETTLVSFKYTICS